MSLFLPPYPQHLAKDLVYGMLVLLEHLLIVPKQPIFKDKKTYGHATLNRMVPML